MTEETPKVFDKGHWTTDPFAVIFTLLLIGALVNGILMRLEEAFGINPEDPVGSISSRVTGEVTERTPLSSTVRTTEQVSVFDTPDAEGRVVGNQFADARGVLTEGPVAVADVQWWYVDFLFAPDGWVPGQLLRTLTPGTALSSHTDLGSRVQAVVNTDLLQDPGGVMRGMVRAGMFGSLVGGPFLLAGVRWWEVSFENGERGWVPESALERVTAPGLFAFLKNVKFWFVTISLVVSALLITCIVLIMLRLNRVRTEEMLSIWSSLPHEHTRERNIRWEHVLELVNSERPSEWRQAVIEADIILDEMVTKMGYQGDSLGEKLKQIEPSDFLSLNAAWEAHKIRNLIAHQGSDFILTQREARRVIGLYEDVFKEFYYV